MHIVLAHYHIFSCRCTSTSLKVDELAVNKGIFLDLVNPTQLVVFRVNPEVSWTKMRTEKGNASFLI